MKKKQRISDAELEVIQALWDKEKAMSIQEISDALAEKKWAYRTVATMLLRMEEKGAVVSEKQGRVNYYHAVLDKKAYVKEQTQRLVTKLYHGSVKELAVSLFEGRDMTEEDKEEIRAMFNL